jgi:hypothetical protein
MTSYYPRINKYTGIPAIICLKHKIILPILLLAALIITSCKEEYTSIGAGLLPGKDYVQLFSTDTITAEAYTIRLDSIASTGRTYSYLGGFYDPYFGNTYTDFVSQLRLTKKYSGGEPLVDSVKLYMPVTGVKGHLGIIQNVKLYEIADQLSSDTIYYSSRTPNIQNYIGSFPLTAVTKDTIQTLTVTLPVSFGNYLMRDTLKLNQDGGSDDFRTFFKGLYVAVETGTKTGSKKGSIPDVRMMMSLEFSSGTFMITVYYHTYKSSGLYYDFIINSNSVRYNRYLHDYSTAEPTKMIKHINDGYRDTATYIQGFNGVLTRIKFPGLGKYKSIMPISVNKTRLVFSVFLDDDIFTTSTVPSTIYMSYIATDGTRSIVPDYYVSPSYFDGIFNSSNQNYTFNLASFAQEYLEGKIPAPEVDMYLPENEYRNLILKANSPTPVKFLLVYTKF